MASQRRLERKLKELNMVMDEERETHTEQKEQVSAFSMFTGTSERVGEGLLPCNPPRPPPLFLALQLSLKVKALKRQVDEGETELERIDTLRRKAQRDLEEQLELKEALQARVTALETDLK